MRLNRSYTWGNLEHHSDLHTTDNGRVNKLGINGTDQLMTVTIPPIATQIRSQQDSGPTEIVLSYFQVV
jgi:hypothetical protein